MAQKHLRELLQEEQEPFQLKHFIADRCFQIRQPCRKTDLKAKKRKPISGNPGFPSNLCESSCFSSGLNSSPELRSPGNRQNRFYIQVPATTAAILLEAAAKIQKQPSSSKNAKSKTRNRGNAFGLFGSVFRRLTDRRAETLFPEVKLRLQNAEVEGDSFSTRTNAVFSERVRDSDSEPSSSSQRGESFEVRNADAGYFSVCDSPSSSSGEQTPHFTSPATSPTLRITEVDETVSLKEQEREEDNEQCSPVSVLDPPNDKDEDEDLDLDLECSFEAVHRAKQRLLEKLRRFEKLAKLDPMELERKLSEQEEDETLTLYDSEEDLGGGFRGTEEESISRDDDQKNDHRGGSECRRWRMIKAWKGFKFGFGFESIDEIMERDVREGSREWMRQRVEVQEAACDVELSIFSFLVEEFSLELVFRP